MRRALPGESWATRGGGLSASTSSTVLASATVNANTETQSSVRHAGRTPSVLTRPGVGLSPMMF